MTKRFCKILSSAPTLAQIERSVTDYYAGCVKVLHPSLEDMWDVRFPDGRHLMGAHVRKKRGRYLLVTTESE